MHHVDAMDLQIVFGVFFMGKDLTNLSSFQDTTDLEVNLVIQ